MGPVAMWQLGRHLVLRRVAGHLPAGSQVTSDQQGAPWLAWHVATAGGCIPRTAGQLVGPGGVPGGVQCWSREAPSHLPRAHRALDAPRRLSKALKPALCLCFRVPRGQGKRARGVTLQVRASRAVSTLTAAD